MSTYEVFEREAQTIFDTYQPVLTEVSGIYDVAMGIAGLAYSTIWRLTDSEDLGTGTPIATQAMQLSGVQVALGVVKLKFPIIISIGFLIGGGIALDYFKAPA